MKTDDVALCALVKFIEKKQEELTPPPKATFPRDWWVKHQDAQIVVVSPTMVRIMIINDEGLMLSSKPIHNITHGVTLIVRYQELGHITEHIKRKLVKQLIKTGLPREEQFQLTVVTKKKKNLSLKIPLH